MNRLAKRLERIARMLVADGSNIRAFSSLDDRKERIKARVKEVVSNLDKGSDADYEYRKTLEYSNSWTPEWKDLVHMMICYKLKKDGSYFGKSWGMLDRTALIELMTDTLYKAGKDFEQRNENTIYTYEFEAEHDGDIEGICEELKDAGAVILKTKADFDEETGYAFFTVKDENVKKFEEKIGKLWQFR